MGAQQSGAQPGANGVPFQANLNTLQKAANQQQPTSAPLSTGNIFPAPVPIQKPPQQPQAPPQQQNVQQPVNNAQKASPQNNNDKQNLFLQPDKAGFTMQEEFDEEEEYEESQNMFATGFRSALKQNQGSINSQGLNQFGSAENNNGGSLQGALKDFKANRQQSELIEKENMKLPKMTQQGSNPPAITAKKEAPIQPPVQPPQIPKQNKIIQPVLTPQPVKQPEPTKPPQQQPKQPEPAPPKPAPPQQQQPKPVQPPQQETMKSQAGIGLSYQSVRQIEDESAGFMTQHKPQNTLNQFQPKMQITQNNNSFKRGLLINTQDDYEESLQNVMISKERMTMKTGGLANGDLPSIEDEEMESGVPYSMGERGLQGSVTSGLAKDRARPPSNYQRPQQLSMSKFNEINAPPRLTPQSLWPDQNPPNNETDHKQDSYMRKTPSNKEVVSSRKVKAQEIQLMSQGIRDSQVNDFGSHYSQDKHRRTPKGSFPGLPDESAYDNHTPGHRTQTQNLLSQVKHELDHGPVSYEPLAKVDQEDIKDYYKKQDIIKENPGQAAHLLAPNQKKPNKGTPQNKQLPKQQYTPQNNNRDDLETTQVFKSMKQKYDEDLLSQNNHESVRSITQIRAAAGSKQLQQQQSRAQQQPPNVSHQRSQSHMQQHAQQHPYLQVGASTVIEDDAITPMYQQQQQQDSMDFSRRLNQYAPLDHSMESSRYFPGLNDKSGLNKQFGVYTFEDKTPLFERKARLIERLIVKKNESGEPDEPVDRSKFKIRSIPGGAGHQIVFSNRSEQKQHTPSQHEQSYGQGSSQYLSCADRLELQKLYKMSTENLVVRDFRELHFNQPFPLTQAKSSRSLSPLYAAVATGCLESVNIIFEEMTWINVESGIEIKKKFKDDQEELMLQKGDKPIKKRTPLQLACALGLYKIVELLLSKGANANGIEGSDVSGHTDFYFPPIVLCASKKLRQTVLDELVGISIWQVYDNNYEVSHVQCLEALLRNKADPNMDISAIAPAKPFPVFYCLKQRNFVAKLVQYGGDVNVRDRDGLTPLCRVIDKPAKTSNKEGVGIAEDEEQRQLEVVDTLVGLGKAHTVHCCLLNPVLTAIKRGKYIIARYVAVKGGGDVNWRGIGQPSAVQIAVDQDNVILLEEVLGWPKLESPLDLDYTDPTTGTNIFHRIAKHLNIELFTKLLESSRLHSHPQLLYRCLNTAVQGQGPESVPLLACCPNIDLAQAYLREGAGLGGLTFRQCYERYCTSDPKFLEFLLNESGQLDVNEVDPVTGHTCLITAAEANDLKKMHFLLRLGADPDCRYPEDAEQRLGMTLLHEAALKGKVDQARILLSFGSNFNLKCHRGRTTLDFLRTGHEQKSNRRREEMKTLLYKYTVKNNIFNK
ncbi:hypothetical protein FGO68_gene3803 [Halteria grandinella]|uniref:Uncharacterized protein n=1 Tax=Halteria grandinella TaxID=5974 RepID=A0A8J8P805_HALGN|nr:hypothetical protein FGO68_gene3803 [Halteria grandinella]